MKKRKIFKRKIKGGGTKPMAFRSPAGAFTTELRWIHFPTAGGHVIKAVAVARFSDKNFQKTRRVLKKRSSDSFSACSKLSVYKFVDDSQTVYEMTSLVSLYNLPE